MSAACPQRLRALLLASLVSASAASAGDNSSISSLLADYLETTDAPGVSVYVLVNGERYWDESRGLADIEQHVPMSKDTVVRIGSISKTMTAVAAVRLAKQGVIDFDKAVAGYIEDYGGPASVATPRQLASHTGGVRSYQDDEYVSYVRYENVRDAMRIVEESPLLSPPGTQFHYTSAGYTILSAALSSAAGKPFETLMQELVWQPFEMESTGLDDVRKLAPNRGRYYESDASGRTINSAFVNNSFKWAGGGMLSSTRDLADYGSGLFNGCVLTAADRETLFAVTRTNDGSKTAYGVGWYVDINKYLLDRRHRLSSTQYNELVADAENRELLWHSGTAAGSGAMLMIEPANNAVLALAVNKGGIEKDTVILALDLMTILNQEIHH